MPTGFGKGAETSKGRFVSVMAHLKKRIVEVMTEENCLAHALVIAIARVKIILITKPIGRGGRSCLRSTSCYKRQASISVEEEGSLNQKPFNTIYRSIG